MTRLTRLIQLNAKADEVLEFRYNDDDDDKRNALLATGGAGIAAGAGGVLGHQAIQGAGGYGAVAGKAAPLVKKGLGAAKGAIGGILAKLKGFRLESISGEHLVQLSAVLDEVIELDTDQKKKISSPAAAALGAGIGAIGGYDLGQRATRSKANRVRQEKVMGTAMNKAVTRGMKQGQGLGKIMKRVAKAGIKAGRNAA